MTASEVFKSVTGSGSTDFTVLVKIVDNHRPWCLIGGLAVNCYALPGVLDGTRRLKVLGEEVPVASLVNITQGKIWAWTDKQRRATKRKRMSLIS